MLSCDDCSETYDGDPPCDTCKMTKLWLVNELAWKIWEICSMFERPSSFWGVTAIRATSASSLVKDYDGTLTDFEKVLFIEKERLPWLRDQQESKKE